MKRMFTQVAAWWLPALLLMITSTAFADTEPNDDLAGANPLEIDQEQTGTLGIPTGDTDDYYVINLTANGDLTITGNYDQGLTGFIYLYNSAGTQLGYTSGGTGDKSLTVHCIASGNVYVRASRNGGSGSYSLTVMQSTPTFANDTEPNGGPSVLTSIDQIQSTFQEGEPFEGQLGYANNGQTDSDDWYFYISPRNGDATVTIQYETTLYGWVYFYHTDGTQLGYSYIGAPAGNEEASLSTSFTATCQSADTLVIRVNRSSGCGSYLGVAQTSTLSNDNDVEPNGTASFDMNAVQETFNEFEEFSGQIGYDNAENGVDVNDWFYYISPRNGNPSVHITYDATFTGWIYLYQKDGTQLGYSQIAVPANNEEPTLTTSYTAMCQAADTLLIRVARAGGCGSYFGHAETSVLANANDVEPNNSLAEASEVFGEFDVFQGQIGYDDADFVRDTDDWFLYVSPRNGDVTFTLNYDATFTGWIYIYQKDGVQLGSSQIVNPVENEEETLTATFTATCQAADTLYFRVNSSSACGSYSGFGSTSLPEYANDTEVNNTINQAIPTNVSGTNFGQLGYDHADTGVDNNDWYSIEVVEVPFEIEANLIVSGTLSGWMYLHNPNQAQITYISISPGENTLTHTATLPGTYYFRLNRSSGCGSYSLGDFCGVHPEVSATALGDTEFCPYESVVLDSGNDHSIYTWRRDGAIVGSQHTYEANQTGTYQLMGYDVNGCEGESGEIDVLVYDLPAVGIEADDDPEFCDGGSITLTATGNFDSFEWNTGNNAQSIVVDASGEFTVTGTTTDGCIAISDAVTVVVNPLPVVDAGADVSIEEGSSTVLTASGANQYVWSPPAGLSAVTGQSVIASPNETTTYTVLGTDANGCESADTVTVTVVPAEVFDCPALSANIGDSCNDGNADTENDVITSDCECIGTVVFDCPALSANIGDACDDGIENTIDDVITENCDCEGTPAILENTAALCSDGIDNDGDGLADCEDPKCQAISNNVGCLTCFEDGLSFADEVLEYEATCTNITPAATNPMAALGMPDYSGSASQHVSLGRGFIKLGFTNNTLINSGTSDPDLFVFEVGPLVEGSSIELRPANSETEAMCIAAGILDSDGDEYYEFGEIGGALASVDIDAYFDNIPASSVFFDAVKITDAPGSCSTGTPGADIDAVCALSSVGCAIGATCDDGNPDTENDVINVDCECEGTPIVVYDCPDLEANFGDSCNDGNADTENDVITANCECAGTPIEVFDCPALSANIGDACDDENASTENDTINEDCECAGTPIEVFDCPALSANIGDACDDGNADTENDVITANCECAGTPIEVFDCPALSANIGDACDDGNADTENDTISENCACVGTPIVVEFDCPDLEANIGDACNDGDDATANDVITDDCSCAGTPVVTPECQNFVYYLTDHAAADGIADVYGITISGGVASMTYIATSDIEIHIAYNLFDNLIYAVSKHTNSYRTLDPLSGTWGAEVSLGGNYGELTAAVINGDGKMLIGSQTTKSIYSVNLTTNLVSLYDMYSPVTGGDLAFGSDGMLYLATRSGNGLYQNWPSDVMPDVMIGNVPSKVTGLAITATDELLVSAQGQTSLQVYNTAGANTGSYTLELDGEAYTLRDGDLASGCVFGGGSETPEEGECYATEVIEYIQGTSFGGGAIDANRTDESQALGAPERTHQLVYVTLGYGGSLTLAFDGSIPNGDGDDIEVVETSYNNPSCTAYPEYADVYVSVDGSEWHFAKIICRTDGFVDISDAGDFEYVNYVKIVNNDALSSTPDGFDVDGVVALHNCLEEEPRPFIGEPQSALTSFPNPTSGLSEVVFITNETTRTVVEVYDMSGRNVATIFNAEAQEGVEYRLNFDGASLPNGVYIYRMTTENESIIDKFMIAR